MTPTTSTWRLSTPRPTTQLAPVPWALLTKRRTSKWLLSSTQFDFGLRPSVAYLQSKGKDLEGYGDQDILKYVDVGATYYFNKNMSTYVDYKINLLDDNSFTRNAGVSTDDIVALGLVYQF
ncbi:outer membrane protein C [Klebsiella michiganensis]|nr:outer membrane protein C [Klebsiella michiganensis]